jgi:hypothetical protein
MGNCRSLGIERLSNPSFNRLQVFSEKGVYRRHATRVAVLLLRTRAALVDLELYRLQAWPNNLSLAAEHSMPSTREPCSSQKLKTSQLPLPLELTKQGRTVLL